MNWPDFLIGVVVGTVLWSVYTHITVVQPMLRRFQAHYDTFHKKEKQ